MTYCLHSNVLIQTIEKFNDSMIFATAAASESCIILYEEATVKEHDFARVC